MTSFCGGRARRRIQRDERDRRRALKRMRSA